MDFKSTFDLIRAVIGSPSDKAPSFLRKGRGKVASTRKTSEVISWPNVTAAQFEKLPGHEKTALYFATSASVRWQAAWHNDFRAALDWFSLQLSIQDRKRLWGSRA